MALKNDIFRVSDLRWSCIDDILAKTLGKVDYIEQTDKGLKIHLKKEKSMMKIGDVIKTEEFGDFIAEYTVTDVDCHTVDDIPCTFKVEMICKPKRKTYNGAIFVDKYPGLTLSDNTVYPVVNGIIKNTNALCLNPTPFIFDDMNDVDLSRAIIDRYGVIPSTSRSFAFFVKNDKR